MNPSKSANPPRLARRRYGSTDIELSVIGLGGILLSGAPQADANRIVADAVERGVNYYDVAPTYGDAEIKLGPALEPYRKDVFLAGKTTERDAGPAKAELDRSLKRLRTDHFDLYQLHGLTDVSKDVDRAFANGGVMDMLIDQKKAGRVRHLGFSAHSADAALAAMDRYDFDSILFPVNFVMSYRNRFEAQVIARAQEKGAAILALKALARQVWPKDDPLKQRYTNCWYQPITDPGEAALALRFTLSQPVTAALPPGEEPLFRMALDLAMNLVPITPDQERQLRARAQSLDPLFPKGA